MSSDDEAQHFLGDEQTLHGDSQVVADLTGADEAPHDDEDSDNDVPMPEQGQDSQDDSVHTFEGHTGATLWCFLHAVCSSLAWLKRLR